MNINRRHITYLKVVCIFVATLCLIFSVYFWQQNQISDWFDPQIVAGIKDIPGLSAIYRGVKLLASEAVFNPYFYLSIAVIFALEKIIPADKSQKVFSVGMWQDVVWFVGEFFVNFLVALPLLAAIGVFYSNFLSQYSVNIPSSLQLPAVVTIILALLITDFFSWVGHVILHKVPFLRNFHGVHHSQRELNLFSNARFHFGEAFIYYPLTVLPLYLLLIPLPGGIYLLWFRIWYPRLYHANIKTNFGWLRYILVTPQSHRLHHSRKREHRNLNFGVVFSFWDRLFRTQSDDCQVYPPTGIGDPNFPYETQTNPVRLVQSYCQQIAYPFHKLSGIKQKK